MNNIASMRVAQAMQGIQTRLAEIEERMGISFSAQMLRAQSSQGAGGSAAVGESEGEHLWPSEIADDVSQEYSYTDETVQVQQTGGFGRLPESSYDSLFVEAAERYGISAALIKAVGFAESTFRPGAVSQSGAMGLMQLMPYTAEALGVNDPFDPAQNIDGGARLLAQHLDRFGGDALLAVAAYNCGPYGVTSRGITDLSDPEQRALLPAETRGYLARIEQYLGEAQALYVLSSPYAV
ncbi:MAG: lytic transglycosylase domain-containing protein [Oscillospiraceae bacterium]|nr:lytic transglycosylase domain-containing protein [Oscillospiraceae bacterium]